MTSANIVGYTTMDAPAAGRYVALGVKFENVGDQAAYTINTFLKNSSPKGATKFGTNCDNIWVWDEEADGGVGAWAKYYYHLTKKGFCAESESGSSASLSTTPIKNGQTILFFRGTGAAAASLTLSGGVFRLDGQKAYEGIESGRYAFVCYPWPIALNIQNIVKAQTKPKGATKFGTNCDNIWIWDGEADGGVGAWAKYYYHLTKKGYCAENQSGSGAELATYTIPAGEGFLFFRGTGTTPETITFNGPDYVAPAE